MQLSVSKLATRAIQPQPDNEIELKKEPTDTEHTGQTANTHTLDNKVSASHAPPNTSPADFPGETERSYETVSPGAEDELSHDFTATQKDIEQGLQEAGQDQQESGIEHPALTDSPAKNKDGKKAGWTKATYGQVSGDQPDELLDTEARLRRTKYIPGLGGVPNTRQNRRLHGQRRIYKSIPLANTVFRELVWDTRESHFTDFYADPLQWPEPLVLEIIQWYRQGICLLEILGRIVKPKQRAKLPAFTLNTIGSIRLIDIYALLASCVYIGNGTAFPGDPRYQKFGIAQAREPVVSEEHPGDTELPLDCFLYAYKRMARTQNIKWVDLANELQTQFGLNELQVRYTFRQQLSKSIKRRLVDIRKLRRTEFDPVKTAKALLKQAELHALAFRHGDQVLAIIPWPNPLDVPLSTIPGQHIYPLSYLIEGLKSLQIRLDEPAHDVLQHLRNLMSAYLAENRPAVTTDGGTLTGFISQGN